MSAVKLCSVCVFVCRCTIQNSVVCSRARIEDKVTLKDCLVGANFTITKEGMPLILIIKLIVINSKELCICLVLSMLVQIELIDGPWLFSLLPAADLRNETLVVGGGLHF